MPLFRRRGRNPEPPEWASFLGADGYATFAGLVDRSLERLGLPRTWSDGAVRTEIRGQEVVFGLSNLAQLVHGEPQETWPEIVDGHFATMRATYDQDTEELGLDEAEPLLKLRVWHREDLPPGASLVERPWADDLAVVLSLDLPDTVATVSAEQADAWGRPLDELFGIAAANTQAEPDLHLDRFEHGDGVTAFLCTSDGFFAGSQVLWPERIAGPLPPEGALVAVPNRHLAWILPLHDVAAISVLPSIVPWLHLRHHEGPGSISPELYWWRDGVAVRQPAEVRDETVQFTPTDGFVAALERLGGDEPAGPSR